MMSSLVFKFPEILKMSEKRWLLVNGKYLKIFFSDSRWKATEYRAREQLQQAKQTNILLWPEEAQPPSHPREMRVNSHEAAVPAVTCNIRACGKAIAPRGCDTDLLTALCLFKRSAAL